MLRLIILLVRHRSSSGSLVRLCLPCADQTLNFMAGLITAGAISAYFTSSVLHVLIVHTVFAAYAFA